MPTAVRILLLALWLLLVTEPAAAIELRALIVREDTAIARQTSDLVVAELSRQGWSVTDSLPGGDPSALEKRLAGETLVITLGAKALAGLPRGGGNRWTVAALVSRAALDELPPLGERSSVILLDQPAERWASLVQLAFPGRQSYGAPVGPTSRSVLPALQRRLGERQLALTEEAVTSSDDLVGAVERLLSRVSVLIALPDPVVHNRNTIQPLLLTTYRAGVPVVAYSESYLQAGAVLALYSTPPQIVAQVVETIRQLREGRAPLPIQQPRYFTVGVNSTVARSLGLKLPSGVELKDRLRGDDQ